MKTPSNRRKFLKQAALFGGAPMIVPSSVLGLGDKVAPSNRITVGGIGLGPRGRKVLSSFLVQEDCQFVGIADPQKERREIIKRLTDREYKNTDCVTYDDMAGVLERDDIDAVIIATGDRWHTTASVYAARAGKDIYCEKPCAMNMQECRELDEEVARHGRVFQAGTQRRNVGNFGLAKDLAKTGKLGNVTAVHAGILALQDYLEPLPEQPLPDPADVNWDKWVGPAPMKPFNEEYCKGRWRNHSGFYAAWRLPEWGAHTIDLCQWAAGADDTAPIEYEAVDDNTIHATYENGVKLVMRLSGFRDEGEWTPGLGSCPVKFEGDEGWVEAGDFEVLAVSDDKLLEGRDYEKLAGTDPINHVRDFLDSVKTREQPKCNSKVTRNGHLACFAAATSWKLGRKVTFDPVKEEFINDDEANSYRSYERRGPYTI